MINLIFFIAAAVTAVLIYRQGLKDGQKMVNGERITDKGFKIFKPKSEKDNAKLIEAIKARMEFGSGVKQ